MEIVITILLLINLGGIAFQDFKERRITVLLFVPLAALSFFYPAGGMYDSLNQILINGLILLAIYILTWTYFKLRGKSEGFIGEKIGWGDVFILLAFIPLFESIGLIGILESSAVVGILYYLIFRPVNKEIPFAGIIAMITVICLVLNEFASLNFFTDEIFANLLMYGS